MTAKHSAKSIGYVVFHSGETFSFKICRQWRLEIFEIKIIRSKKGAKVKISSNDDQCAPIKFINICKKIYRVFIGILTFSLTKI